MRVWIAVLAVAVSSLDPVRAQSPQARPSDTIPKELVTLLLRGPGVTGENFDITIGAPETFPRELLPDGATAAVSSVSERSTTVIAEAPQLTDDTRAYVRKAEAAGWISHGPMSMRGLVSSAIEPPLMFCQGDRYATVYLSPRPAGGRYARISLTTDPRRGVCQPMPRYMGPSFFADITLPFLTPPDGSRSMGTGSSSGSDHHDQRLRMQTTLTVEALVKHYVAQLRNDGWKLEGRGEDDGFAIARLVKMSSINEAIIANLIVNRMPNGDLDVAFRLMRVDPNRRMPPGRAGGPGVGGSLIIGGTACCAP